MAVWRRLSQRLQPASATLLMPRTVGGSIVLSFLSCLIEAIMVVITSAALGRPVGVALAFTVLFGINIAIALPSLPASAGVFEAGATFVLMLMGFDKDQALAFAILYHLVQVVPVTIAGGVAVVRAGFTLGRLDSPRARSAAAPLNPVLAGRISKEGP